MLTAARAAFWLHIDHPVWMCGMRPFFLFTAGAAVLLMLPWLLFLGLGVPPPAPAGGPFAWHAHELLFGFALASVLGFVMTAVPEFTETADFGPAVVRRLALLWLAARAAFWATGVGGTPMVLLSGLLNLWLIGELALRIAPRLWRDPQRAHLSFLWSLLALAACAAGFHAELLSGTATAMRWLHASVGAYVVLIVVALSRISMRIVNQALDDAGLAADYLARPPRRKLVIACVLLYTVVEFTGPGSRLSGWLAMAAAAAAFHLLNDWHVGRTLLQRRPLVLYGVYMCMGVGYALMGAGLLTPIGSFNGGRHVLLIGAIGLAVFAAMSIAGRAHCGLPHEQRGWMPLAAIGLVLASVVRAAAGWLLPDPLSAWMWAGVLWCLGFGLYLGFLGSTLASPRADGRKGCQAEGET